MNGAPLRDGSQPRSHPRLVPIALDRPLPCGGSACRWRRVIVRPATAIATAFVPVVLVVGVVMGGLVGCSTYEPPFRQADLAGMVYSTDFLPVAEARVSVDGSLRTLTDRAGRFQISGLAAGSHVIRVTHSEHLAVRLSFTFHDRTQLLHVSLEPVRELEEELVKLLVEGSAQRALNRLQRYPELPDTISLLKAVALTRTGRFDRALSVVRHMGGAETLGDLRVRLRRYIRRSRAEVEP